MREEQMANKEKPRYDGKCRDLQAQSDGPFVIRFKSPLDGDVAFDDAVCGKITIANKELDDLIIARTDGTPTYNFTVVVDDMDMAITHVVRGMDHINNTPRQINILRALGADVPVYAHVPMILDEDGKKLSKRTGAVGVMQYREDGFLPEALINYLVRLGWSHGDQEVFSVEELVTLFDIQNLNKSAAAMNMEKLLWLNQYYMKNSDPLHVAEELKWHMQQIGVNMENGPALEDIVVAQAERTKTLREMAEKSRFFYEPVVLSEEMRAKVSQESLPALRMIGEQLAKLPLWEKEAIHKVIKDVAEIQGLKMGKVAQPLRIVMTGGTVSPSIDTTILMIGKEKALERLKGLLVTVQGGEHRPSM